MKNELKTKTRKLVECPECLGLGLEYEPDLEKDETCKLCKGKGKVGEDIAENFDPLSLQLKERNEIDEEFDYQD